MKYIHILSKNILLFTIIFSILFALINLPLCILINEVLDYFGMNTSESPFINYSTKKMVIMACIIAPFFETLFIQALLINTLYILIEKFKMAVSANWITFIVGIIFSLGHYNGTFELCFFTLFTGVYFSWFYHFVMKMKGNKIALFATSFTHSFWNFIVLMYPSDQLHLDW
jgi:hypothetical protein